MILKSLRREDLVVGNNVVKIDGSFYHVYKIENVTNNIVTLTSTYIIFRGRKYQEEIDGTIYHTVTSIDKHTDTEIGLVNRDLNVNIELLLEEGGN